MQDNKNAQSNRGGTTRFPLWVQAEEKYGSPIPPHVRAAIALDERRRGKADRIVRQYTRGLLSVQDMTMELLTVIEEVE